MIARFLAGLCLAALPAYAQDAGGLYDDHGKRDPFAPLVTPSGAIVSYESDLTVADMNLEGILMDPKGKSLAIINGKILRPADQIGPWRVDVITGEHVELIKDDQRVTLKLKKGGT
jgi:hypothetical protein